MKNYMRLVSVITIFFLCSCSEKYIDVVDVEVVDVVDIIDDIDDLNSEFSWAETEGVKNVLRRASQLASIQWIPLHDVPYNLGFFESGVPVTGIPYSSTKQIQKYVGLDVSFHTFMTAVHNPYSVLYTENLSMPPYSGVNCATYYGDVCSTCVEYALGIEEPYPSNILVTLPEFELIEDQSLDNLKAGDVLHSNGHVFMIFKITKNPTGHVLAVTCFESGGDFCRLYETDASSLAERIDKDKIVAYRYKLIDQLEEYTPSVYTPIGQEKHVDPVFNDYLCPNRGDQCVYRFDEDVIINVFDLSSQYSLVLENEDGKKQSYDTDIAVNVGMLQTGIYKAYLSSTKENSESISFVVAEPEVNVTGTGIHHISFSCENGIAKYCVLCDKYGSYLRIQPIDDFSLKQGFIDIEPLENHTNYYCKIVFETIFGTVTNTPILITK